MNQLANSLPVHFEEKQKILDAVSMTERYEVLMALLLKEIEIIAIKNDFQAKVKAHVDKNQKEYLLREQMKVSVRSLAKIIRNQTQITLWMLWVRLRQTKK